MRIRELFTNSDIRNAMQRAENVISKAAKDLTTLKGVNVSPQLLRYWVSCMDDSEVEGSVTQAVERTRELARSRNMSTSNNSLRRDMRAILDENQVLRDYRTLLNDLNINPMPIVPRRYNPAGKKMTVEALFSDLQIGKLSGSYNSAVARQRVIEYGDVLVQKIQQHVHAGYDVELIKLIVLGDIIESDKKHINSARGCDMGTAEQMKEATELLVELIGKLAMTGIQVHCVMVTGNHDWDGHGMNSFMAGQEHLSWPLYNAVRMVCEVAYPGAVTFDIPRGAFHLDDIYGTKVLYEHGVGVASSQAGLEKRRDQRAQQLGVHIAMFRMGDKHNICRFNNDRLVVNGAFFSTDKLGGEYSSLAGYHNEASQVVFCHVERKKSDPRSTIFDSLVIQLHHII